MSTRPDLAQWELDSIAREVDSLTPGSEPLAPPPKPPWWQPFVAETRERNYGWFEFRLIDQFGGHWVDALWLELNRHQVPSAALAIATSGKAPTR